MPERTPLALIAWVLIFCVVLFRMLGWLFGF